MKFAGKIHISIGIMVNVLVCKRIYPEVEISLRVNIFKSRDLIIKDVRICNGIDYRILFQAFKSRLIIGAVNIEFCSSKLDEVVDILYHCISIIIFLVSFNGYLYRVYSLKSYFKRVVVEGELMSENREKSCFHDTVELNASVFAKDYLPVVWVDGNFLGIAQKDLGYPVYSKPEILKVKYGIIEGSFCFACNIDDVIILLLRE